MPWMMTKVRVFGVLDHIRAHAHDHAVLLVKHQPEQDSHRDGSRQVRQEIDRLKKPFTSDKFAVD